VAATFGVAMLMTQFAVLYGIVQIIGGLYLIWLGLMAWKHTGSNEVGPEDASPRGYRRAAATGFLLSLTNPKIVIFFSSIFVAMLPVDAPMWVRLAALGIVAFQETLWYALVACVFSHHRVQAGYRRIRGGVDRVMGTVFIALGARIVAVARI
jgi:threonine efflux protein